VGVERSCEPDHPRAQRARKHPVPLDVDAGQLGGDLVVAQGAERPSDVRPLKRPVQGEVGGEERDEHVERRHHFTQQRV
jgi:hypothetical protein